MKFIKTNKKAEINTSARIVAVFLVVIALTATTLIWGSDITGMQTLDKETKGKLCTPGDLEIKSPSHIVLHENKKIKQRIKLSCPDGNITLYDNSENIDLSSDGDITLLSHEKEFSGIIIAEHESGKYKAKKIHFSVK